MAQYFFTEEKEQDEAETKPEKKKEVPLIPDDFFYEYDKLVSKAAVSDGSGLPEDMLKLQYPLLYVCQKDQCLH